MAKLSSVELCAGAGGQALGLEKAGFRHQALVDIDAHCCRTLQANRRSWNVINDSLASFDGREYRGVDLLAAGLPCPPFSIAGKKLGQRDDRDLFPHALRLVDEIRPKAVMIENVRGFLDATFSSYRDLLFRRLKRMGYQTDLRLLSALDYGVPQARSRTIIIAVKTGLADGFEWPRASRKRPLFVGEALYHLMGERGWEDVQPWRDRAKRYAPTLVGGSLKHGGPDLGPTRSKQAWTLLGVDGHGVANEAPAPEFKGMPRLTVRMAARLQGFPDSWKLTGAKTPAYRQVGNAFPPPVARAVGRQLAICLAARNLRRAA